LSGGPLRFTYDRQGRHASGLIGIGKELAMHRLKLTDIERLSLVYSVKLGLVLFLVATLFLCLGSMWSGNVVTWSALWPLLGFILLPAFGLIIAFGQNRRAARRSPQ
jgi:hypothetical protein